MHVLMHAFFMETSWEMEWTHKVMGAESQVGGHSFSPLMLAVEAILCRAFITTQSSLICAGRVRGAGRGQH